MDNKKKKVKEDEKKISAYKNTTFFGMLKINGISFFLNYSLLYSIIIFILIHYFITEFNFFTYHNYNSISSDILSKLFGVSSAVFGIVIAALAVSMSIFNTNIIEKLEKTKLLHKFLFPFWFLIVCWGLLILFTTFLPIIKNALYILTPNLYYSATAFCIWLFIYSLLYSINITGLLIRLFIQNSRIS